MKAQAVFLLQTWAELFLAQKLVIRMFHTVSFI